MENGEWNSDEHQGRRKDQVEYANKIGTICVLLSLLIVLLIFILTLPYPQNTDLSSILKTTTNSFLNF